MMIYSGGPAENSLNVQPMPMRKRKKATLILRQIIA
jgi:hypothetical protein